MVKLDFVSINQQAYQMHIKWEKHEKYTTYEYA